MPVPRHAAYPRNPLVAEPGEVADHCAGGSAVVLPDGRQPPGAPRRAYDDRGHAELLQDADPAVTDLQIH
jgi:hypothetical protein